MFICSSGHIHEDDDYHNGLILRVADIHCARCDGHLAATIAPSDDRASMQMMLDTIAELGVLLCYQCAGLDDIQAKRSKNAHLN